MSRQDRAGVGIAAIVAAAIALVVFVAARRSPAAQTPPVPRAAPGTPPPLPVSQQVIVAEAWRTDGAFVSEIHMQNVLEVGPLTATPTLYMADGTPYVLPPVTIPAAGAASININRALAAAPASLGGDISQYGSVALSYTWVSPGHLSAALIDINVPESLTITRTFAAAAMPSSAQMLKTSIRQMERRSGWHVENASLKLGSQTAPAAPMSSMPWIWQGLWWRHDPGVHNVLALANSATSAISGRWRFSNARGRASGWHEIELAPHATSEILLDPLIDALPPGRRRAGGITVQELGTPEMPASGNLLVGGWMTNPQNGFSADLDIGPVMPGKSVPMSLAAAGMMVGSPMGSENFPDGIKFQPYGYLRNTTQHRLRVKLTVSLGLPMGMSGAAPQPASAAIELAPGETRRVDLAAWARRLQSGMAAMPGEGLNWSAGYTGWPGQLVMTAGSVDQTGNYVFQILPQRFGPSIGAQLPYWSTADGNDTMYSLWNPGTAPQNVVLDIRPANGASDYQLDLRLAPGGSTMVDIGMLRAEGITDAKGRLLPPGASYGSAMLMPADMPQPGGPGVMMMPKGGMPTMQVVYSMGVFNARLGTCGDCCGVCCGFENSRVIPSPFSLDVNGTFDSELQFEEYNGFWFNDTSALWTATGGDTYDGNAKFTATAVGTDTVDGSDFVYVTPGAGDGCTCGCPQGELDGFGDVTALPGLNITMGLNGSSPTGSPVTNATESVVVGQQVQLQANYDLSGGTFTSSSWSIGGTTAGGWTPRSSPSPVSTGGTLTTVYWTAPGNGEVATFSLDYRDAGGNPQVATASVTFNAAGPTGANVSTTLRAWEIASGSLSFGDVSFPGVVFNAAATPPSGYANNFDWVQVITSLSGTCEVNGTEYAVGITGTFPSLDSYFPYASGGSAVDYPSLALFQGVSDETYSFAADMYLLWSSGLSSSIDVPLGYVSWSASGHASGSPMAVITSGTGKSTENAAAFTGSGYPTWGSRFQTGSKVTCGSGSGGLDLAVRAGPYTRGSAAGLGWADDATGARYADGRRVITGTKERP